MDTKIFKVDRDKPDMRALTAAAEIIKSGGLVAFPTETVYGLGANGLNREAVKNIYRAKGRPSDNPLILHIADKEALYEITAQVTANARALIEKYWPGPLTVVLPRRPVVPDVVTGGLDTVAVRLPASAVTREWIRLAGVPVAGPSANTSGRPSPTTAQAVLDDLAGRIDAVIDAGACTVGVESTVVDCTTVIPTLLRPGGITLEMLEETLGAVEVDPALGQKDVVPRSPGMKYRHYAPKAPVTLFEGDYEGMVRLVAGKISEDMQKGRRMGAIISAETVPCLPEGTITAVYGSRGNVAEIAANLYEALRYFDGQPVDAIVAEGISEDGLGLAVMNRLRKASGYKIVKV